MLDNDNIKSGNVSEAVEKIRQMKKIIKRSLCIIVCYVKSKGRLETSSTAKKIKLRHSILCLLSGWLYVRILQKKVQYN